MGTLSPRGPARGLLPATTPAQEFGEGTRPDDGRSTTGCSSRQRRSRATSPRATTTHRRVRLFATVTSLLRPRSITCCSSRRRRELATSLRASAWAPIPAQELTQATLFPPKRRPRSHFALSPTCSDRTRIAPSPLKNLDSSQVVGNLQDGERVRLHSEHPFPLKNLDSS